MTSTSSRTRAIRTTTRCRCRPTGISSTASSSVPRTRCRGRVTTRRTTEVPSLSTRSREDWSYGLSTFDATHVLVLNYTWMLPKMSNVIDNAVVRATLDNWQVSGISTFASGNPANVTFTTVDNADILGGGDLQGGGAPIVVTGDPNLPRGERTLERWFDTSVFARPATGEIGNGRKDVVRLPGVRDTGLTISKLFPFGSGRRSAQFRWEIYNLFNSLQYNAIDRAARFDAQGRQVNARFGQVTSTRGPRVMQGSLRFTF